MDASYKKLIVGNEHYAAESLKKDPNYFIELAKGQTPQYLWIGCSDSRVPANEITNTRSGEIFVHRNIANLVVHTDTNMLSVLEYAVKYLGVKHIIVCGHYGCGGVNAAMSQNYHGFVDNWLRNIKDVYLKHEKQLTKIKDDKKRADKLTELNVIEQVRNLAKTTIVQQAWAERDLQLHGWVYSLHNGIIKDLSLLQNNNSKIDPIYRYDIPNIKFNENVEKTKNKKSKPVSKK